MMQGTVCAIGLIGIGLPLLIRVVFILPLRGPAGSPNGTIMEKHIQ